VLLSECHHWFLSVQNSASAGTWANWNVPHLHKCNSRWATDSDRPGQGIHVWLCVWYQHRPATSVQHLCQQTNWWVRFDHFTVITVEYLFCVILWSNILFCTVTQKLTRYLSVYFCFYLFRKSSEILKMKHLLVNWCICYMAQLSKY